MDESAAASAKPRKAAVSKPYIWDKVLVCPLLRSLSLVPGTVEYAELGGGSEQSQARGSGHHTEIPVVVSIASEQDAPVQCHVCDVTLENREEQLLHYTTHYHRHNQNRVLRGRPALSIAQYQPRKRVPAAGGGSSSCTSTSSSSSVSSPGDSECNSDTDEELEDGHSDQQHNDACRTSCPQMGRGPRVFLHNSACDEVISVYRPLLLHNKAAPESASWLLTAATDLPQRCKWSYLMQSGGHFAGAVYHGDRVVVHKTFHSYTVRAGQGGSQGAYDNKSGGSHPRSAGATLRRYNEASHQQHILEILEAWRNELQESDLIFVRVSERSQRLMFGSGKTAVLTVRDPRIRSIPFPTSKPTFTEIKRVHKLLAEVKLHGTKEMFLKELAAEVQANNKQQQRRSANRQQEEEFNVTEASLQQCLHHIRTKQSNRSADNNRSSSGSSIRSSSSSRSHDREDGSKKKNDQRNDNCVRDNVCAVNGHNSVSPSRRNLADIATGRSSAENRLEDQVALINLDKTRGQSPRKKKKRVRKEGLLLSADVRILTSQEAVEEHQRAEALDSMRNMLYTVCKTGDLTRLRTLHQYCTDHVLTTQVMDFGPGVRNCVERYSGQFSLLQLRFTNNKTPLHVASENAHKDVVRWLLESGSCDPSLHDSRGHPPYVCSATKAVKQLYRDHRTQHPAACNYHKSLIPAPLTEEQQQVVSEEKKQQKVAKKARQKENRQKKEQLLKEQKERERYLNMSDREKRALAAERRLLARSEDSPREERPVFMRCFQCANDISGLVPFEYDDNKFCSTECVRLHRSRSKAAGNR